ncbi:hypothetical protein cyc_08723 [Cyclospora cayetanensis]|nr:hypothetical protein cyc_08723 [Cyclospora cayetanensis]
MPDISAYPSAVLTTQMHNAQQQPRVPLSLPSIDPLRVNVMPQIAAAALDEGKSAPTPPWRKNAIQASPCVDSWQHLCCAKSLTLVEQQQRPKAQQPEIFLSPNQPLEDPYAMPSSADPYGLTTEYSDGLMCSPGSPTPPQNFNLGGPGQTVSTKITVLPAVDGSIETCDSLPLLLQPPILRKDLDHSHVVAGRPSRVAFMCSPMVATAVAREGESRLSYDAHRVRRRTKARQRRVGGLPQSVPGVPPPLPLGMHCYPPQERHNQQPEKAIISQRRTCYRCRRRGHEANECPTYLRARQMHSKYMISTPPIVVDGLPAKSTATPSTTV